MLIKNAKFITGLDKTKYLLTIEISDTKIIPYNNNYYYLIITVTEMILTQ